MFSCTEPGTAAAVNAGVSKDSGINPSLGL